MLDEVLSIRLTLQCAVSPHPVVKHVTIPIGGYGLTHTLVQGTSLQVPKSVPATKDLRDLHTQAYLHELECLQTQHSERMIKGVKSQRMREFVSRQEVGRPVLHRRLSDSRLFKQSSEWIGVTR